MNSTSVSLFAVAGILLSVARAGWTVEGQEQADVKEIKIQAIKLSSSKFFTPYKKGRTPGIRVDPTGRLGMAHYLGAVYERTKLNAERNSIQRHHLNRDGFIIHWRQAGAARRAGIHAENKRVNVEIEIPASLVDEHTAYTSLLTTKGEARIETVAIVKRDGRFIIREIRVTNTGKAVMRQVEVHEFANLPFMHQVDGYGSQATYDKRKDVLLVTAVKRDGTPSDVKEVCGLAGVKRSAAHSIERGGRWGQSELLYSEKLGRLKGRLFTGISNNAETGNDAGIFVWSLGDLKPGASGTTAAIIAVGENAVDFEREVAAARKFYVSREPLTAKADRTSLLAQYARLNWKKLTHLQYEEFVNPADPDLDGWLLEREKAEGTDPMMADSDLDGLRDFEDPHPTRPEPLIAEVTEEEIKNDKIIFLSRKEIIRAIRGQDCWVRAADPRELSRQLARLRHLRVNCVALRVDGRGHVNGTAYGNGDTFAYKTSTYGNRDLLAEYIAACHRYGIDVKLEGMGYFSGRASLQQWVDKPGGQLCSLPGIWCVNGWMRASRGAQIFDTAKYPVEFICIDEEQYFRGYHGERFVTDTCTCPLCAARFKHELGYELPGLRGEIKEMRSATGRKVFELHRWRKKCSTEAWRYWEKMARARNPHIKFFQQSVAMGGPYYYKGESTNFRQGGLSGVDIGYRANMAYGGDHIYQPYHFGHKPSFNHFFYSGAMKAAIGSVPSRKGWVEYGQFKAFEEPVWCYGSLISAVAHGGKAVEFFDIRLASSGTWGGENDLGPKHGWKLSTADAFEYLRMAYVTIDEINDWVFAAEPVKQIALLWDGAADEVYSVLEESQKQALGDPGTMQARFMTYLFRTGYPFDFFYLHYADEDALKDYPVIVLPSPLCVSADRVPMLERLVNAGASLIILSEHGQFDRDGRAHGNPALLDLAGIKEVRSPDLTTGALTGQGLLKGLDLSGLSFEVRKDVVPNPGTEALAKMNGDGKGIYQRRLGKGQVIFMPGNFVANCMHPAKTGRSWSSRRKPREFDITQPGTTLMNRILDHGLGENKILTRFKRFSPDSHADVEIALLEKSETEKTLFLFNWEIDKRSIVEVGVKMSAGEYTIKEWSMKPADRVRIKDMKAVPFVLEGKKTFTGQDLGNLKVELEPQQIRILNIRR